ncbi:MAG: 2-oxoacid:acceptor oxidoreductase family protein, partial [Candidatus Baldrarchaeia archaeon]
VFGPLVLDGEADVLLSFELVETLRALKKVSSKGVILLNSYRAIPPEVSAKRGTYPNEQTVFSIAKRFTKKIFVIDALKLAKKAGNFITMNVVMLGALAGVNGFPIKKELMKETITELFPRFVDINLKAFDLGYQELRADVLNR